MPDFAQVDHPAFYPQSCIICQSAKGPLTDTGTELAEGSGTRHIYVCELCGTLIARSMGVVEGERMTELLAASKSLNAAKKAVKERDARIEGMLAQSAADRRKIEALDELLQQSRDDASTKQRLAEMIHENSRQLVLANGGS